MVAMDMIQAKEMCGMLYLYFERGVGKGFDFEAQMLRRRTYHKALTLVVILIDTIQGFYTMMSTLGFDFTSRRTAQRNANFQCCTSLTL